MRKRHKFADGGITDGAQQPTYPFYGNQPQAGGASGGVNQTFNVQPQATAGTPQQQYKKGGMTASARADGCAQRGKTRGKMR